MVVCVCGRGAVGADCGERAVVVVVPTVRVLVGSAAAGGAALYLPDAFGRDPPRGGGGAERVL